jgi:hypothetical protein
LRVHATPPIAFLAFTTLSLIMPVDAEELLCQLEDLPPGAADLLVRIPFPSL